MNSYRFVYYNYESGNISLGLKHSFLFLQTIDFPRNIDDQMEPCALYHMHFSA